MAARKTAPAKGDAGLRGVRLDPKHDARTRAKIRTTQIINRLEKFILDELDSKGNPIIMSAQQVSASLGLLKKTLPDLSAVEHSGEVNVSNDPDDYTDEQIIDIISQYRRTRGATSSAKRGKGKSDSVH